MDWALTINMIIADKEKIRPQNSSGNSVFNQMKINVHFLLREKKTNQKKARPATWPSASRDPMVSMAGSKTRFKFLGAMLLAVNFIWLNP